MDNNEKHNIKKTLRFKLCVSIIDHPKAQIKIQSVCQWPSVVKDPLKVTNNQSSNTSL